MADFEEGFKHPDAHRAWQYINIILTNSQLFVPIMDRVRVRGILTNRLHRPAIVFEGSIAWHRGNL